LTLTALNQLRSDSRTVKDRSGWISYQDMLTRVADFLGAEGAEAGIQKIRTRYRVAFVDEFQDTDDLQWRIFSTLFMPADSANRLFLIGDPKQAIYGFRGADVFTYLDARQQLGRLAAEKQANLYSLNINWRSMPVMVDGFNQVFAQEAWFGGQEGKGPFEIGYPAADSPAAAQLPLKISSDGSRRPPFNVVDLSAAGSQGQAKEWLAGFICREIRFIVAQARIRLNGENGIDRPLNFGDIAILVRSQGEFHTLAPQLDAWAIPYAYYRQPGLFQCPQAHWLSMVLKAVLNPQHAPTVKLALLTPFFDMDPASLEAWSELPADHISQRLLARWQVEAQKRRWGLLFQSLVEESGMTFRHCMDSEWERSETNFQQLFDYLEITAYAKNMDAGGLVAHLDRLRLTGSASGTDADIHQIEDEGDKVQILTMHVSKGLEFPVVFIAGGLTMRPAGGLQIYHTMDPERPADGCRKVFDLTGITGREQAQQEFQDENKRLYYVALTRARAKVYVPFYPDDRNHGWIGPICQFVSRSIAEVFGPDGADRLPGGWHTVVEQTTAAPDAKGDIRAKHPFSVALPINGLLPSQADFRHRKISLESFSSIGHRMVHGVVRSGRAEVFSLIDEMRRDDDEPAAGLVVETSSADPSDELPGGTEMGSMFHYIFETIDFKAVMDGPADLLDDPQLRRVMEMAVERFRIDARWVPAIGRIVAHALRCPITVNGRPLCLGQLSPDQRRHEIEFYFPLAGPLTDPLNKNACHLSGGPCREMVVRGFIDLVFTWQDCFYIADWKSNRLAQGYHQDAMAREMKAAGYDLQYQLYSLSTLRWLRQRLGGRFDPQHHFGGVYYLFIRGMGGKADEGAFHVPAQQLLPVEALEETIIKRIADIPW
jgi:exodeoxyribonuclease V beta subunit